ncbi:MAG TPA: 4-alpha-glucanotransferase, partial [Silvibacterium sp.]|nr:4-alpha-glucanotransferase [Silvibacterium sp.]
MPFERSSGLLLHITSLPSYGGIGDFGPAAYAFADFLAEGKQRLWQVLPLSPTGYGNSPYAALSAFAGNPLLISLEYLSDWGWIDGERIAHLPGRSGDVRWDEAFNKKLPLIEEAARNFLHHHDREQWARFEGYCRMNGTWLDAFAFYSVLRKKFQNASWNTWPTKLAHRDHKALEKIRTEHGEELAIQQIIQFAFDQQWCRL